MQTTQDKKGHNEFEDMKNEINQRFDDRMSILAGFFERMEDISRQIDVICCRKRESNPDDDWQKCLSVFESMQYQEAEVELQESDDYVLSMALAKRSECCRLNSKNCGLRIQLLEKRFLSQFDFEDVDEF